MSNRKRDQKIVEEILGFQPLVFYRDINEAVISDLEQGMNSFRKELTTVRIILPVIVHLIDSY